MRRICAFFQENCVFCHKSVKLGTVLDAGNNLSGVAVQFATQFWANATQ